jgi:hypothetical protein
MARMQVIVRISNANAFRRTKSWGGTTVSSGVMGEDVYVGIDVSKTELVVAVRPSGESFTLAYERAGLKQLVGRLDKLQLKLVVVEATGGLQRQVVAALWTAGIGVVAVHWFGALISESGRTQWRRSYTLLIGVWRACLLATTRSRGVVLRSRCL